MYRIAEGFTVFKTPNIQHPHNRSVAEQKIPLRSITTSVLLEKQTQQLRVCKKAANSDCYTVEN